MKAEVLQPVGVRVAGELLAELSPASVRELKQLLANHGVVILSEQDLDDSSFVAALRRLGDLRFTSGETPVDGCPDLNVVSNTGRATPPKSTFHVDTSYVLHPPAYTALRAVAIPAQGGETLFTNQYRAYDTLDPNMRDRLAGRTITHVVTGLQLGDNEETSADHPILALHPISGRISLYLSTPKRCASISGMTAALATETVIRLFEHSTRPENIYRHTWAPGDVVIWDNRCVLHCADHTDVVGERILHRGMVAG